jgi:two-component system sensor histidine kinase/response regulator
MRGQTSMFGPGHATLQGQVDRLFVQRLRAAFWIVMLSVVLTTAEDVRQHFAALPTLLLIKAGLVCVLTVLVWSLRLARARAHPVAIGLLGVTATCIATTILGIVRQDLTTTHLVLLVIALASAAVLPWGLKPQLVAAGIAALCMMSSAYALTGRLELIPGLPSAGVLIAFGVLFYVTYEFARYRRTIEQRTVELLGYQEVVEQAHDLIQSATPDGTLTYANRAWREALGYGPDQIARSSMWGIVHPDDRAQYADQLRRVVAGEDVGPVEIRFVTRSGRPLTVEGIVNCAVESGQVTAVRGFFRDITERKQAEDALRRSEQHFRSLIENASDLITVMAADGTIKYDSPAHERVLGYTAAERSGSNALAYLHPDDAPRILEIFAKGIQVPGQTAHLEYRYRHKDGSWRYFEGIGTNLLDDPAVAGVVVNSRDITERKQMEEALRSSEEYLKVLFEFAPDTYYLNDAHGRFVDGNRAAEQLTGYQREELIGQDFLTLDLIAAADLPQVAALLPRSADEPTGPFEIRLNRKDRSQVPVEIRTFPVRVRGSTLVLGIARDITQRKQVETELQRAKNVAEAASRAKSEFLAHMSHEIRTPMNGIMGMTELLLDTPLLGEQREYLEMVKSSADALLNVINDILDFSKIEAGKLDVDPIAFALRSRLGDTIKTLAARAHEKGLELTFHVAPDVPDAVIADLARLRQILVNLVGNAIKFTEHGEVAVEVGIADCRLRTADWEGTSDERHPTSEIELHVSVRDTGIGIAPEQQQRIFSAFEQVDASAARKYGGSGLGLTISSRLVGLLGGRMWVESSPGTGSIFHFTIRAQLPQTLAQVPIAAGVDQLRRLPVLVVDDNDTNRHILREMLSNWHMLPTTVDGGRAALTEMRRAAAAGIAYPLVLLDAIMPEIDGFAVAEQIRRQPELAGATIMMLTSGGHSGEVARCRALGVTAYLIKPIKQSDLLDAILIAVGQRSFESEPCRVNAVASRKNGGAAEGPMVATDDALRAAAPLRILLAEDNVVNQRLAVRMLEKRGHLVAVAATGREAVAAFERERFDVVLMDVQMPEMDGLEATAEIRRREQQSSVTSDQSSVADHWSLVTDDSPHIPIIAMTAHAMKGDEERCLQAGMDGYVAKPIQAAKLFEALAALVPGCGRDGGVDGHAAPPGDGG